MQYEICLEMASKLEVIKERHLQDSPIVKRLADLIHKYNVLDLEHLNELAQSLIVAGSGRKEEPSFELSPESLLRTELLSEDLAPWVRSLRKRLFGKVEAPFDSYDSAVNWVKEYDAEKKAVPTGPNSFSVSARRNIRYSEPDGTDTIQFALINSPLEKIIFASQKLTKQLEIGLDWNSLVFYVLADIPPFIPPLKVNISSYRGSLPSGREVKYRKATVEIREGFNLAYLRWLYEVLRREMGLKKKKGFNARHLELYRLVKQRGGEPQAKGTIVSFWKSVMDEWNTSHTKNRYESWKGVKKAYERVISKLKANTSEDMKIYEEL